MWQNLDMSVKVLPIPSWHERSTWSDAPEHNEIRGSENYRGFLDALHKKIRPRRYLEIGVQTGVTLVMARCRSIGIDPDPQLTFRLKRRHKMVIATSDDYFERNPQNHQIDLAFIDGMHLAEFALRDFINVERNARAGAVVVLDDIFPNHPLQAERARQTRPWMGDIWKVPEILEKYRPDLKLTYLNTSPSGLLVVENLNPQSTVLADNYDTILGEIEKLVTVPDSVLRRDKAIEASLYA